MWTRRRWVLTKLSCSFLFFFFYPWSLLCIAEFHTYQKSLFPSLFSVSTGNSKGWQKSFHKGNNMETRCSRIRTDDHLLNTGRKWNRKAIRSRLPPWIEVTKTNTHTQIKNKNKKGKSLTFGQSGQNWLESFQAEPELLWLRQQDRKVIKD